MKKIIVTGDDFGLAVEVNKAIVEGHRSGILTVASLMVGADFFRDAVERARACPSLKVGLHLTLVEGKPVLPPHQIPDLVRADGAFSTRLVRAGFRFFLVPGIRKQLEAEIRAQFEAFRDTGLALDHVNAHNHMHLHPTILRIMIQTGRDYGLKAVRLPVEPPVLSWKATRRSLGSRLLSGFFLYPWMRRMKSVLRNRDIRHNDFLFGMSDAGAMTEDLILKLLRNLPHGTSEFCFHPAVSRCPEIDATMPLYRHEDEFKALTSAPVRRALQTAGIQLIAFGDL